MENTETNQEWKLLIVEAGTPHSKTSALEVPNAGCLVRIQTQYTSLNGNYTLTEAVTFVPWVKLGEVKAEEIVVGRKLVPFQKF